MANRFITLVVVVVMLIAGLRLAWVASVCETGWGFVVTQWQDAVLGFIGRGHTSVGHVTPSKQADYWLGEVDRAVHEHPNSPSIHMGAAWVLDSPDIGFLENHIKQRDFAQAFPQMGLGLDEDAISTEKAAFREKCIDKCLEMAERSTEYDPNDVRWWRMRALLLFEGDSLYSGQEFETRDSDWLEVLEECKTHDSENALYDYLAALKLWNTSASYDWPLEPGGRSVSDESVEGVPEHEADDNRTDDAEKENVYWILTVHDSKGFALGVERFVKAQELPFLAIGEAGYSSIAEFLANSRLRKADQAEVAISRLVTFRHSTLFHRLWRWQNVRVDDAKRVNDHENEMSILRQSLRLYDQAVAPDETSALSTLTTFGVIRQHTYEAVEKLTENHPTIIDSGELASIRQREELLRLEASTLQSALQTLKDKSYPKDYAATWPAVISVITSTSAAALLIAAGAFMLASKLLSSRHDAGPTFGILRHATVWITGCGITFVVLGMAPAEMISHEVQRLAIITGIWLFAILISAAAVLFVVKLLRQRKIRFRLITLFAIMTGVAVLASLWPLMKASFDVLAQNRPDLWLHAKGWSGIDAEVLRTAMKLEKGSWYWATLQWFSHGGVYVGLFVSLLLATLWFMRRSARKAKQGVLNYWTREIKSRWSTLSSFIGRSAFTAALGWVFLNLCLAPYAIPLSEAVFQHRMKYCRDPKAYWNEIRDAQAAVSPENIKIIREQVHFGMFGDGVLEQDFSGK